MQAANKMILWPVVAIPLVVFSTGCANVPKAPALSAGGAVAGAVVGARVAGPTGALVGAVIGGVAGYSLGSYLDEEDKKKLAAMELQAVNSGKSASFVTGKSKAKVTVTPEAEKKEQVKSYTLASNVSAYPLMMTDPTQTIVKYDTPIYRTVDSKQEAKTTLSKGSEISIPAQVENNSKWGAVVENDTVIGYVPLASLNKPPVKAASAKKSVVAVLKPKDAPVTTAQQAPATPVAETKAAPAVLQTVHAMGTCKTIVRTVDTGNKAESFTEQVKYCKEPPKGWKNVVA